MHFRHKDLVDCRALGSRVTVRYRMDDGRLTDAVGTLESCDEQRFGIRNKRGALILVERAHVVASKIIPSAS